MQQRAAYRTLVRQLKSRLGGAANARPWLEYVAEEFRGSAALSAAESSSRLQLVTDYVYLLQSTHEHLDLLLSYNIGIDRDARQRDTMKRSAASVGLQLPQLAAQEETSFKYGSSSSDTSADRAEKARHVYDDSSGGGAR